MKERKKKRNEYIIRETVSIYDWIIIKYNIVILMEVLEILSFNSNNELIIYDKLIK